MPDVAAPAGWARGPRSCRQPAAAPRAARDRRRCRRLRRHLRCPTSPRRRASSTAPRRSPAEHGTEVASAISGAVNGTGVMGVFPSVPLINYGLPTAITCSAAATGILAVVQAKATRRQPELRLVGPVRDAVPRRRGRLRHRHARLSPPPATRPRAGNAPQYPAAWPHVLSVAALNEALAPASFSTRQRGGLHRRARRERPARHAARPSTSTARPTPRASTAARASRHRSWPAWPRGSGRPARRSATARSPTSCARAPATSRRRATTSSTASAS